MTLLSEETVVAFVDVLVRLVETAGAVIIFTGCVIAFARFVVLGVRERRVSAFTRVRLDLGRMLALGLEFQLASDVLRTAVAPTLTELAELAAVAAIRTALNFFLAREIREERAEIAHDAAQGAPVTDGVRDTVALGVVAAGLLSGIVVAVLTRAPLAGVQWLLDFLLAAGLLRLSAADTPTALATAAGIVAVRQVAGLGLRRARAARAAPGPAPPPGAGGQPAS